MTKLISAIATAIILQSCTVFSGLSSTTYIDASKVFVLGEGRHGSYNANIRNVGEANIEVVLTKENRVPVSFGILKPNDSGQYPVPRNAKVEFRNLGTTQAIVSIKAKGDTNLSMGYQKR